eukprot:7735378-Pyramimonas_sp.AAC.1
MPPQLQPGAAEGVQLLRPAPQVAEGALRKRLSGHLCRSGERLQRVLQAAHRSVPEVLRV